MFDPVSGKPFVQEGVLVPAAPLAISAFKNLSTVAPEVPRIIPSILAPRKYALKLTGQALFTAIGNCSPIEVVEVVS